MNYRSLTRRASVTNMPNLVWPAPHFFTRPGTVALLRALTQPTTGEFMNVIRININILSLSRFTNGTYGRFSVAFPSNCPYITSVGATMVKPNTAVTAANLEEVASILEGGGSTFTPGGDFSDFFSTPKYQKSAIKTYFKNYKPPIRTTVFLDLKNLLMRIPVLL